MNSLGNFFLAEQHNAPVLTLSNKVLTQTVVRTKHLWLKPTLLWPYKQWSKMSPWSSSGLQWLWPVTSLWVGPLREPSCLSILEDHQTIPLLLEAQPFIPQEMQGIEYFTDLRGEFSQCLACTESLCLWAHTCTYATANLRGMLLSQMFKYLGYWREIQ